MFRACGPSRRLSLVKVVKPRGKGSSPRKGMGEGSPSKHLTNGQSSQERGKNKSVIQMLRSFTDHSSCQIVPGSLTLSPTVPSPYSSEFQSPSSKLWKVLCLTLRPLHVWRSEVPPKFNFVLFWWRRLGKEREPEAVLVGTTTVESVQHTFKPLGRSGKKLSCVIPSLESILG